MKIVVTIILVLATVVFVLLARNQAHFFEEPGLLKRLAVYLTQNVAQTEDGHPFPELRPDVFRASADELYLAVQDAIIHLGWAVSDTDDMQYRINAVVTTQLLLFQDDVEIKIRNLSCQDDKVVTALDVRSSSRVGKADLGANAGHIQSLMDQVRKELRSKPRALDLQVSGPVREADDIPAADVLQSDDAEPDHED
jgi:uncharacterized protein (DUF1499 family)